jgi:hypothetical protein|tara:strand:- start:297 stop:614 length:318 start_codon:yes stop_codon:yes gene_type:complete
LPNTGFLAQTEKLLFKISLAEWSLHRALWSGEADHLDFTKIAIRKFGVDAVEYVNTFFFEKAQDKDYLKERVSSVDGEGVNSLLIMCDAEGTLSETCVAPSLSED